MAEPIEVRDTSSRRGFTAEIQLGAVLQSVTVVLSVSYAVFTAGNWVGQVRGDLQSVQHSLSQEVMDRKADTLDNDKQHQEVMNRLQKMEGAFAPDVIADLKNRINRLETTYQRAFVRYQPQPKHQD